MKYTLNEIKHLIKEEIIALFSEAETRIPSYGPAWTAPEDPAAKLIRRKAQQEEIPPEERGQVFAIIVQKWDVTAEKSIFKQQDACKTKPIADKPKNFKAPIEIPHNVVDSYRDQIRKLGDKIPAYNKQYPDLQKNKSKMLAFLESEALKIQLKIINNYLNCLYSNAKPVKWRWLTKSDNAQYAGPLEEDSDI